MSNIYLVTTANADNAFIKFTYWSEPTLKFAEILGIIIGGLVFITALILLAFLLCLNRTIRIVLEDTVKKVKFQFQSTIEKMEEDPNNRTVGNFVN